MLKSHFYFTLRIHVGFAILTLSDYAKNDFLGILKDSSDETFKPIKENFKFILEWLKSTRLVILKTKTTKLNF